MADLNTIKLPNNSSYNVSDNFSEWGGENLLKNIPKAHDAAAYNAYDLYCIEDLEEATYTIQLWDVDVAHSAKTTAQLGVWVYYCGGNVSFGNWAGTANFTDGHADHLTLTFTVTAANLSHSSVTNTASGSKFIRLYNSVPSANGTRNLTVEKWKLEKGRKATDWSPCYKDIFTVSGTQLQVNL